MSGAIDHTQAPPVRDLTFSDLRGSRRLMEAFSTTGGFQARKLAQAADILAGMLDADQGGLRFLSFPAALMATGIRGLLTEAISAGWFDIVITTCGTLDHDLARSYQPYLHGEFELDDTELLEAGLHRLGNVLIPHDGYGPLIERELQTLFDAVVPESEIKLAPAELLARLGDHLAAMGGGPAGSFLAACARRKVPIFVPGIVDGAFGTQLWMFDQRRSGFTLDLLADQQALSKRVFGLETSSALMIGGGISKHHTIWWNQFKGGLDAAIYLTTAVEYDGSLSGARIREAVSWGKVKPQARYVTVDGDASITLPLLFAGVL